MQPASSGESRTVTESGITLAPPGAGVPAIERLVGRLLIALRRRRTPAAITAEFRREQAAIARLYRPLDDAARSRAVLIPRLRGLEDSSRCWSIRMTLSIHRRQIVAIIGAQREQRG